MPPLLLLPWLLEPPVRQPCPLAPSPALLMGALLPLKEAAGRVVGVAGLFLASLM